METLLARYDAYYTSRAQNFASQVSPEAYGIPAPHLPLWGSEYASTSLKIGVVGRDTRGWGAMSEFIETALAVPETAIHRHQNGFDHFEFTKWTRSCRHKICLT
ncbi:MAG: hypothetical protein EOP84_28245 [Verrucomicrobiaceae bacterium]|nr:MAG: hypothetical protein EOP84_28245 [Verrucomicrobiaceae bacterium]